MKRAIPLLLLLALPGCATLPQACIAPARPMMTAELLFGRNIGGHVGVSEAAFAAFTVAEIAPRFPDGFTLLDARGQWRDPARGVVIREPSKLVQIVFTDDAQKRADLAAISQAYKTRFRQESVLTALHTSCVTF